VAKVSSSNTTTLYSTTQTTPVKQGASVQTGKVNNNNFTTLYSNPTTARTGGSTGNLLVDGNLRVTGTSDLEGLVTIGNAYSLPLVDGTNTQVLATDGAGHVYWTDNNDTTYTINASTTTGGANFNLVGSDSSLDTIKFAGAGNTTVTRTDANTITITSTSGGGPTTFGNITIAVVDDNTIGTTTGDLILEPASGTTKLLSGLDITGDYLNINVDNDPLNAAVRFGNSAEILYNYTNNRFDFSKVSNFTTDVNVAGNFTVQADAITINSDKTDLDTYIYFGRVAPNSNAAIRWNKTSSIFEFSADLVTWSPFVQTLSDLSDVNAYTPSQGNLLYYNGSLWVNSSTINTSTAGNRPIFQYDNSTAGVNSALFARKNFGSTAYTTNDGVQIGFQLDSDSQAVQQIANVAAYYDSTAPVIYLATNANANTTGPFVTVAAFASNLADVASSTLTLDADNTGAATDAYYKVNRGSTGADVALKWNETTDRWQFTNDGTTYYDLPTSDINTTYTYTASSTTGGANLNLTGSDSSVNTIKLSNGTGVTNSYVSATEVSVAIGQDVSTTADVTFSSVAIDSGVSAYNTQTTTTTSTSTVAISSTTKKAQRVAVIITNNVSGEMHTFEALAMKKGTTAYLTTFAEMYSASALATFTADVSAGSLRILATPASTNSTTFEVARISLGV